MADTLPNVPVPARTVVDLYAESGLSVGTRLVVNMIGTGIAFMYFGESLAGKPDNSTGFVEVDDDRNVVGNTGDKGAFIWSTQGCVVNVGEYVDSAITLNEASTIKGCKFTQVQEYIVDIATPLYILYDLPSGEPVTVELIKRLFTTDDTGADMLILWDYDVSTATKTPLTTFNENNEYRGIKESLFEVSVLNPVSINATTGVADVTGAATIADMGIIRESSFISTSGVGSNTTGDIDPALGFRRYKSGTGFVFKVTSRSNNNKIIIGYTWTETGCD